MSERVLNVFPVPKMMPTETSTTGGLAGSVAVIIDVLRATTTITHALAAGASCVVPCLETRDALEMREKLRQKSPVLLGGERGGVRIEGFDFGNSPEDYTLEQVSGKTLVFSTTNGTRAMFRVCDADDVFVACFNNATAAARCLAEYPKITILCAGTDGRYTEEDMLLAGFLVERLTRWSQKDVSQKRYALNTYAVAAKEMWDTSFPPAKRIGEEPIHPENLAQILRQSRGGKNLMQLGLGKDIMAASRIDIFDFVPLIEYDQPLHGQTEITIAPNRSI